MIATIRRKFGKQAFNFVTWVTLFSLAGGIFVGGLFRRFSGAGPTAVAEVNGHEIGPRELQRKIMQEEHQISQIRQQFGKNAKIILEAYGLTGKTEERALKALITQKLLVWAADKIGIVLSPDFVSSKLADPVAARQLLGDFLSASFVSPSGVNYRELLKALQKQGISARCVEEAVEERIKQSEVINLASLASYVPEEVLKGTFDKVYRPRKLLVVKVPVAPYLKKQHEEKVGEDVLRKFYEENKDRSRSYISPEKRTGRAWVFENVPEGFMTEGQKVVTGNQAAFDEFVKKYKGTPKALALTERKPDAMTTKLFSLAQGVKGIGTEGKKGFVVEPLSITPEFLQEFPAVKEKVAEDYARVGAVAKLSEDMEELKTFDAAKRSQWVTDHKGTEKVTQFLSFDKPDDYKELQKEGVPVNEVLELEKQGDKVAIPTDHDGYLVELFEYAPFDEKLFQEKKEDLLRGLTHEDTQRTVMGFIASLEKNAKIKTNKSLFNRRNQ